MGSMDFGQWVLLAFLIYVGYRILTRGGAKRAVHSSAAPPSFAWPPLHEFEAAVVGESHYQRALREIAGDHGDDAADLTTTAVLIPDDKNPHDNKAVRVEIDGRVVGHLSRDDARTYRRRLGSKKVGMVPASCGALVMGGFIGRDGKRASYGVLLDIKPFD